MQVRQSNGGIESVSGKRSYSINTAGLKSKLTQVKSWEASGARRQDSAVETAKTRRIMRFESVQCYCGRGTLLNLPSDTYESLIALGRPHRSLTSGKIKEDRGDVGFSAGLRSVLSVCERSSRVDT